MVKKTDSSGRSSKSSKSKKSKPKSKQSKKMDRTLNIISKRKKNRQKDREDKNYLEYRKQNFTPSNPPATVLREGDEAFPKRRRSLESCEKNIDYLSGNSNVAPEEKDDERKPKGVTANHTDHSVYVDNTKANLNKNEQVGETDSNTKYGNRAQNPLDPNGLPFWISETQNGIDDLTDDELPINTEILERICNNDLNLAAKPFKKTTFNPFGPVQRFKFDDALFDHDSTLFTSTIETVISTQPDDEFVCQANPIETKIKWSDKIRVATYDPCERELSIKTEEMKDIKRENVDRNVEKK